MSEQRNSMESDSVPSLALTIDEIRWLHASETIMESPVETAFAAPTNCAKDNETHTSLDVSLDSSLKDLASARTSVKPPDVYILKTPPTPIPTPPPIQVSASQSSLEAEWSTSHTRTPPPSAFKIPTSPASRLALVTDAYPSPLRIQPSLHRNRTWSKNRHYQLTGNDAGSGSVSPASSIPVASSSSSMRLLPYGRSPAAVSPTTPTSAATTHTSSIPIPIAPRTPTTPTQLQPHAQPLSRSLPTQPTQPPQWIYRHPKPRARTTITPPTLSLSTSLSSSTSVSLSTSLSATTSTPNANPLASPKTQTPPSPSRLPVPIRPRTRSTTARNTHSPIQKRTRPQTGYLPIAKKPVHSTLPARKALNGNTNGNTNGNGNGNGAFWTSMLLRPRGKGKGVRKEGAGKEGKSGSEVEGKEKGTETGKGMEKGKEKAKERPSLLRPPQVHQRTSSLSSTHSSVHTSTDTLSSTSSTRTATQPQPQPVTQPTNTSTSTSTPTPIPTPSQTPPETQRTRSTSSSSASSNSSSGTSHSSSTAATSTSASPSPSSPSSTSPTSPGPSTSTSTQQKPIPTPSKSILTRSSSTSSSARTPLAALFHGAPCTGAGTAGSAKSVTFVDEPTVHYPSSSSYPGPRGYACANDVWWDNGRGGGGVDEFGGLIGAGGRVRRGGSGRSGRKGVNALGHGHGYDAGMGGVDVDGMDLEELYVSPDLIGDIEEEDEDADAEEGGVSPTRRQDSENGTPKKKSESSESGSGLKRLMSLTRRATISTPTASPSAPILVPTRPAISGPFALGSHHISSSLPTSSSASLRSHVSRTASITRKRGTPPTTTTTMHTVTQTHTHTKSHSYSHPMAIPPLSPTPKPKPKIPSPPRAASPTSPITPTIPTNTNTNTYTYTSTHIYTYTYPASLRPAPSLESFRSTAGRSVRSLGSVKSTASTRGFRAWLARIGEGIGMGGVV